MWIEIKNFPNYFVNELGQVKSGPKKTRKGFRLLKPMKESTNYTTVDLCKDGKIVRKLIHRIVAEAFLPNLENKPQVNHINGIKDDNRLENLEWVTRSENQLHSIRTGLRHTRGENNSQCKLKSEDVLKILNDTRVYSVIGNEFKVSISTVADIKRGYSWTHITGLKNIKKENG